MKKGDKVKVIKEDNYQVNTLGKIGIITQVHKFGTTKDMFNIGYEVYFNEEQSYNYYPYELEHIKEEKNE